MHPEEDAGLFFKQENGGSIYPLPFSFAHKNHLHDYKRMKKKKKKKNGKKKDERPWIAQAWRAGWLSTTDVSAPKCCRRMLSQGKTISQNRQVLRNPREGSTPPEVQHSHGPQPALEGARRARSCSLERTAPSPPALGELQKQTLKHLGTETFPGTRLGLGRALRWTNLALLPLGWKGWMVPYRRGWKEPEAGHPPAACTRPKRQRADAPSAVDLWTFVGPGNSPFSPSSLGLRVSRFPSSLPRSSPSSYRPRRPSARRGHCGDAHTIRPSCT